MKRGNVVILRFPFRSGGQSKVRPALIVQNDRDNRKLQSSIVALITGNLKGRNLDTHVFVDPLTADGASSGLHGPSLVNCSHLYSIDQSDVKTTVGVLAESVMDRVDAALRTALAL